ncbi:hypothetical protein CCAX7_52670 [Capsulimonas corticalis]|uniref:Uncharacterized protein n=2 Tax=Capsulimonas corticalis TaxID=2219043 RepID=A0A402CP00_9BACT|nr:hypothetical protein CCAX7_52670 [Capsulimonas corticalis]
MYEYKSHDAALYCDGKNMYLGYHTPLMWDGSGFIAANEDSARHILASSNWKDNGFDAKKGWRLVRQQDLMTNNISQKKTIFRVDGEDYCFDYDDREINGNMSSRISLQGLKPGSEKHIVYNEYDGGLTTMFSSILTYWKIRYP